LPAIWISSDPGGDVQGGIGFMLEAGEIESLVSDPKLVEERRGQIIEAATVLFSRDGFHRTTIQAIARQAGISTGLVYQYFHDKDDVLFLTVARVLETYDREIPKHLQGVEDPLERLCRAFCAYCRIVDQMIDATVLAYRSTKSLKPERRRYIMAQETETNRLLEDPLAASVGAGHMRKHNAYLLAYQLVSYSHAWALKQWTLRERYDLDTYIREGVALLIEPFLTETGAARLAELRAAGAVP
jgi:AcrR family transcriptional regulator